MTRAEAFCNELRQCGVEFVVWLPDIEARFLYPAVQADPGFKMVQVCREDEAIGIHYGLHLAGREAVVLIQNAGVLNAVDAIRGYALDPKVPLLMLAGYRGYHGMLKGVPNPDSAAVYTEPILKALGVPYYLLDINDDVGVISRAYRQSRDICGPVAVLYCGRE